MTDPYEEDLRIANQEIVELNRTIDIQRTMLVDLNKKLHKVEDLLQNEKDARSILQEQYDILRDGIDNLYREI